MSDAIADASDVDEVEGISHDPEYAEAGIDEEMRLSCELHDIKSAESIIIDNIADLSDKWLSFACEYGFTQICLKLLDLNLNVNHRCNITGWTPLLLASEKGYIDCINALINKGADINMKAITPSGWTSLHGGSEYGHCDVVLKLINNGAIIDDIDHSGKTPLMISCLNGNVKLTKLLLENGANYNILNNEGRSALALASYNGHIENISLLVMWGANFSKSDLEKKTPLHCSSYNGHVNIVKYLLRVGINIDAQDTDGDTALHIAHFRGHFNVALVLIESGASLNIKNHDGENNWKRMLLIPNPERLLLKNAYTRYENWKRRKNFLIFLVSYDIIQSGKRNPQQKTFFTTKLQKSEKILNKCMYLYYKLFVAFL